jgi:intracellular multiplication protein IcmT
MVVLVHVRLWTFYVALAGIVVFAVLEWLGLTFPAAVRTVRRWIVGNRRPAIPTWKKRRFA